MSASQTKAILTKMLREDTGRHLLDSGGAYDAFCPACGKAKLEAA